MQSYAMITDILTKKINDLIYRQKILFLGMEEVIIKDKTFTLYIDENRLQSRISEVAAEINRDYQEKSPLLVPVLSGAFLFTADLVRHLTIRPELQFIRVSTYGNNMESSGKATIPIGLETELTDRHVLIVEDIVDSGFTCDLLMAEFLRKGAASVKIATLLFKPESHTGKYKPDYAGFEIPPEFVIGYGLDYAQLARELRGIYRLKE